MRKVLLQWLLSAIPVLVIVSLITFVLTAVTPGDPGRTILGQNATAAQVAALDRALGLSQPLPVRYWNWLVLAVQGDLGTSLTSGVSISSQLGDRLAVTLSLVVGAAIVAAVVGVSLGTISAVRGGLLGRILDGSSVVVMAIPVYWFALVLVSAFAVRLRIFPASGYVPFTQSPAAWLASIALPVLTLGLSTAAPIAKQTRTGVLAELGRDYVRILRARGFPSHVIILKHVLRNAAAPVLTVAGVVVVGMFGGSTLIETVFVLPGLGNLAVTASASQDIPSVQGVAVVFTVLVLIVNGLIEVLYSVVNPKART